MLYVHVADAHRRPILPEIVQAGAVAQDPEERALRMLSARSATLAAHGATAEQKHKKLRVVN